MAKIRRNQQRDREEQSRLAEMGWHCITVWECELKPARRKETLESLAFTLNHIFLQDHSVPRGDEKLIGTPSYPEREEEGEMEKAAEEECGQSPKGQRKNDKG